MLSAKVGTVGQINKQPYSVTHYYLLIDLLTVD